MNTFIMNFQDEECLICTEELMNRKVVLLPICKHVFCLSCVERWCQENSTCPLDRMEMSALTIFTDDRTESVTTNLECFFEDTFVKSTSEYIDASLTDVLSIIEAVNDMSKKMRNIFEFLEKTVPTITHGGCPFTTSRRSIWDSKTMITDVITSNYSSLSERLEEMLEKCQSVESRMSTCSTKSVKVWEIIFLLKKSTAIYQYLVDMNNNIFDIQTTLIHFNEELEDITESNVQTIDNNFKNVREVYHLQDMNDGLIHLIKSHLLSFPVIPRKVANLFQEDDGSCILCEKVLSNASTSFATCDHRLCDHCINKFKMSTVYCPFDCSKCSGNIPIIGEVLFEEVSLEEVINCYLTIIDEIRDIFAVSLKKEIAVIERAEDIDSKVMFEALFNTSVKYNEIGKKYKMTRVRLYEICDLIENINVYISIHDSDEYTEEFSGITMFQRHIATVLNDMSVNHLYLVQNMTLWLEMVLEKKVTEDSFAEIREKFSSLEVEIRTEQHDLISYLSSVDYCDNLKLLALQDDVLRILNNEDSEIKVSNIRCGVIR